MLLTHDPVLELAYTKVLPAYRKVAGPLLPVPSSPHSPWVQAVFKAPWVPAGSPLLQPSGPGTFGKKGAPSQEHPGGPSRGSCAPQLGAPAWRWDQALPLGVGQLWLGRAAKWSTQRQCLLAKTGPWLVAPWLVTLLEAKTGPENKESPAHPWTLRPTGGSNGQVPTLRQVEVPVTSPHLPAV